MSESIIPHTYKSWVLTYRPRFHKTLGRRHLELKELDMPVPPDGGAIVKVTYLSFDASQQLMAENTSDYFAAELDKPMPCLCTGVIVKLGYHCKYTFGTRIHFRGSYSEYHVLTEEELSQSLVIEEGVSDEDFLTVGSLTTGITAYVGLYRCCKENFKPGNTLVVSAASGGVGQMVIQLAKLEGLRVVGITGGPEKCKDLVVNFGVDEAVDYKDPKFSEKLKEACPNKIDIYFDNVGGEVTDEVYGLLNNFARVAVCGIVTDYVSKKGQIFKNYNKILMTRSRVEGFLVDDSPSLKVEASKKISAWLKEKKLHFEKTIIDFKDAPDGLGMLLSGEKKGKLLARV